MYSTSAGFEPEIQEIRKLISANPDNALQRLMDMLQSNGSAMPLLVKATCYHLMGLSYHEKLQYTEALEWYEKALELRQQEKDIKAQAQSLNNIGLVYSDTGFYLQAIEKYQASLTLKKAMADLQGMSATYDNMGVAYMKLCEYQKAIEVNYESLKISEQRGDAQRMATAYQNIGVIHSEQKDPNHALTMFEKALALLKQGNDYVQIIHLTNNIGVILRDMHRFTDAARYYQECMQLSEQHNYRQGIAVTYNNMGEILLEQGQAEEAVDYFQKCYTSCKENGHQSEMATSLQNKAEALIQINRLNEAETALAEAIAISNSLGNKKAERELYLLFSTLREKQNLLSEALDYYKKYNSLLSSLVSTDTVRIINELKTKYEVEKKEKESEIHRLKNIELKEVLEDLTIEKRKSEKLLLNILPEEIAFELKRNGKVRARQFESVSVMFADIKSFTKHSEHLSPDAIVGLLDMYFEMFDSIMQRYDVEKIKTIGDAYLCVCGLPNTNPAHAQQLVAAAIEMRNSVNTENEKRKAAQLPCFEFRFGIHSGPVIAGIVGKTKFEYDIWGDTVNTAARMEQSGETGRINISGSTYALVKDIYPCTYRGQLAAKNKGEMDMYFVD